jgi:hypothetical protein
MLSDRSEFIQENLNWREAVSIGKGPMYLLEEKPKGTDGANRCRVAGWVQLNEGNYEAVIPGLPSEALFNKNVTSENSAIKIGSFKDLDAAKSSVEKHLPPEEEWTYL